VAAVTRARAEEHRRKAQECLDLARAISLKTERAVLIDMAQSWLRLAEEQDGQEQPQSVAQQRQQAQDARHARTFIAAEHPSQLRCG
jgi:hypothetical protein